jgi:tRNA A-37 threonylcarbamoyl transferase component Bud32
VNLPPGYERLLLAHAVAVARSELIPAIRRSLVAADGTRRTLYDYAAAAPGTRPLIGRGPAFATRLPDDRRVVVRHNRRGGLFAPLLRDRFLSPTRAPRELAVSLALRQRGVPTPEVLAYVLYPPSGLLQRSDVATGEIAASRDLADALAHANDVERAAALDAAARLVAVLSRAGARHHDLNARNLLLADGGAFVLDVDRVVLDMAPAAALDGNLARLTRSLSKLRRRSGLAVSDREMAELGARARALAGAH